MENSGLAKKTIAGFAQLMLGMGILLFAPAWTLNFWQAWAYLLAFFLPAGLITWYLWKKDTGLLERRVNAGPAAEKEKKQKLIQALASAAFIGIFIVSSLDRRFLWSNIPFLANLAGDILTALGFLAIFFVFKENTFTAGTIELAENQKVISTGPYAIVRHPMYAGALVMLFGTPLGLGSLWALVMSALIMLIIIWRLLNEEKFLSQNLLGYKDYCQKIKYRLIPFIW